LTPNQAVKGIPMRVGVKVKTIEGRLGYVIDMVDGNPVVFFKNTNSYRQCAAQDVFLHTDNFLPIHQASKLEPFLMPLAYAKTIGFQQLAPGYFEFEPKTAKKYSWDRGGIWETIEQNGAMFLKRKSDTGEGDQSNQNENDLTENHQPNGDQPIFDSGEQGTQKTYMTKNDFEKLSEFHPLAQMNKKLAIEDEEFGPENNNETSNTVPNKPIWNYVKDWAGGVSIEMNGESIGYLQPGDEAGEFLDAISDMDDSDIQNYMDQYSVLQQS
jgi:hypothetical protein